MTCKTSSFVYAGGDISYQICESQKLCCRNCDYMLPSLSVLFRLVHCERSVMLSSYNVETIQLAVSCSTFRFFCTLRNRYTNSIKGNKRYQIEHQNVSLSQLFYYKLTCRASTGKYALRYKCCPRISKL